MNKNILIVLGGAVVVAVLVAVLVQVMIGGEPTKEVIEEAKIEILVASRDLSMGSELNDGDLEWAAWPEGSIFPGTIRREDGEEASEALEGRLRRTVSAGEPMLESALITEEKGNFVAGSLKPGMRAVAIKVSAESMVGGFIGPGDFVDIILTYKESFRTDNDNPEIQAMIELNLDKNATETILQNVRVMAVDQTATREDEEDSIRVGKTVTLEVSPREAEKISLAEEIGELRLALRGVGDDAVVEKDWETVSDARITRIGDEIFEKYRAIQEDTGINGNSVRIYSGSQIQSMPAR